MKNQKMNSRPSLNSSIFVALGFSTFSMFACSEPVTDIHGNLKPKFAQNQETPAADGSASKPAGSTDQAPDSVASSTPSTTPSVAASPSAAAPSTVPSAAASGAVTPVADAIHPEFLGKYRFKLSDCIVNKGDNAQSQPMTEFPSKIAMQIEIQKTAIITKIDMDRADGGCSISMTRTLIKDLADVKMFKMKTDPAATVITKNGDPAKIEDCAPLQKIAAQDDVSYTIENSNDELRLLSDSYFCSQPTMDLPDAFNSVKVVDEFHFVKQ